MPSESSQLDKRQNGSTHDDESKSRTRVSRACTRCRTRKDRCDGQRPSCSACQSAHATCCYEPATKKRGLPEGYVRGLEKLFALLMGKIENFEHTASHLMQEHRTQLLRIWNHATVGEELHTTWKEGRVVHELETLLAGLDAHANAATAGHKRKRDRGDESEEADEEVDPAFHVKPQYSLSRVEETAETVNISRPPAAQSEVVVDLPSNAVELVDHYFAHTHCWFPIVDRPQVLRACYELSRGKARPRTDESTTCLLWAIFAYTSRQTKSQGHFVGATESHTDSPGNQQYRATAQAMIPTDAQLLTRTHAQTFLILALLDIGRGNWRAAWSLVGQAVRIVLCDASETLPPKRNDAAVFQGCAILDIAIANHLAVVPHLRRSDFEGRGMMSEDGHEEWEPWAAPGFDQSRNREPSFAISCFNRLTEVLLINADMLTWLQQPEKLDRPFVQSLLAKLHQLQTTAPGTQPSLQSPPHQIYLQLCHVAVQIRLVGLPVDTGAGSLEKAKLACNVLGLLELCKNARVIGLEHVPPFLVDGIESACKMARSLSSSFGSTSGLPSYHEFDRTASELANSMASTWPIYASTISTSHQPNHHAFLYSETPQSRADINISPHAVSSPPISDLTNPKRLRGSFGAPQPHISTPLTSQPILSSENISLPDLNQWQYPLSNQDAFSLPNTNGLPMSAIGLSGSRHDQNISHMSSSSIIGLDGAGSTPTGALGLAVPEPSPSFHGDEIDAIFHEMAHLDTNEWTTERTLGLRDFGFSDDLTFQAFCNDPERLMIPGDGPQQALSSNSQTWTFTNPGSRVG